MTTTALAIAAVLAGSDTNPPAEYDPDFDNCAGGCKRNDNRRVVFAWYQDVHFACPGCFEELFAAPPHDRQRIITLPADPKPLWYCEPCKAVDHVPMPGICRVCGAQMQLAAGYGVRDVTAAAPPLSLADALKASLRRDTAGVPAGTPARNSPGHGNGDQ